MKLNIIIRSIISTFLLIFLNAGSASAEYCDMVGGTGDIEWIHIPRSQLQDNGKNQINYNSKIYEYDRSKRLLVKDEIPSVNDTVKLNQDVAGTQLPSCLQLNNCDDEDKERWKIIKQVDKYNPFIFEQGKAIINTSAYQCTYSVGRRGCWDLNSGATLKILGFTYIEQILFALVRVENC